METRLTGEPAGFPSNPKMNRRREAFEPLCDNLARTLEAIRGPNHGAPLPARVPQPVKQIPCEGMRCEACGRIVAFLIFADAATNGSLFEDVVRLMVPHYVRQNVPTYIIRSELGGGPMGHRRANILKVWRKRGDTECLRPSEFNPRIKAL